MKGSSVLSFKSWPKIHPPLPRTPRESQQLLSALTSSFRRQLDAADSKPVQSTDQHLRSILDNPLFRVAPSKSVYAAGAHGGPRLFGKRLAEEPMAVFDELTASGSVSGKDIAECLTYQLALAGSTSGDARTAMRSSGAGSRVVSWFWASDSAARKTFFKSRRATMAALKFMAAEELQDTVMVWLRMLSKRDLGGLDGHIPEGAGRCLFSNFLSDFMAAEILYGRGIASALGYFVQMPKMCTCLVDRPGNDLRDAMLVSGATFLGQWIIDHRQSPDVTEIPMLVYDAFCEAISTLPSLPFLAVATWLYHPTHPTAEPLLEYVARNPPRKLRVWDDAKRELFVRVYLDGFRMLLDQEQYGDASDLAPFVKQLISSESSPKASEQSPFSTEQDHLLARLDLTLA
jgi:hypothetical protein